MQSRPIDDDEARLPVIEKRVGRTGKVTYRAHVRRVMEPGSPPRSVSKSFTKFRDAEEWHAEHDRKLIRERAGLSVPSTRAHLSELRDRYLAAKHERPYATSKDRRFHLDWWVDVLNDPPATRVRGSQIRAALDIALEDISGKTANRYLSSLSSVYRWAIRSDLIEANPCSGVERRSELGHVVRFLTDQERASLWGAVKLEDASFRAFYLVSLWTGGRFSEVLGLKWRAIDTKRQTIAYPATKGGRARSVPAPPDVFKALTKLGTHGPDEPVFPSFSRRAWRRALTASKLQAFRWHDLRHSFCSWHVQRGLPLADVQQLAGHTAIATTLRYAHLAATDAHNRVRALFSQHAATPSKKRKKKASPTRARPSRPARGRSGGGSPRPKPQP